MRNRVMVPMLLWGVLTVASCRTPAAPTRGAALEAWLSALRSRGFTIALDEPISPSVNGFFAVPAQPVSLSGTRVSAFEYASSDAAAADASRVSADGQPNPLARITWISTPRFYRQGSMIVLYAGCTTEVVQALGATLGNAFVVGSTPCR